MPSDSESYSSDAAGQVSQVDLTQDGQTTVLASSIGYHPNGPINQMQYGNGNSLNQLVDTAYRLTDINVPGVMSLTGALYDGNGNLTERTEDLGTQRDIRSRKSVTKVRTSTI